MISRETRRLLITIAVSIAALWVLARIRFQDSSASPAAVAPVLAQLRPAATYANLAQTVADLRRAVGVAVVPLGTGVALRISADRALTLSPEPLVQPLALDRATGLAIVAVEPGDPSGVMPWVPRVLDYPRYLLVAERAEEGVALRPIFVGTMSPDSSVVWGGTIWKLPPGTPVAPASPIFTGEGAFAGVSISTEGGSAIVPASLLLSSAQRLVAEPSRPAGTLGVSVQSLTPALAAASGASTGVIVSAVDRKAAAVGVLMPTDIIETIDGTNIESIEHWQARMARVNAGDVVSMRIRAAGVTREVQITAAAADSPPAAADDARLGLQLVAEPRIGARVTGVDPQSRADRASLRAGDVITAIGRQLTPTPAQVVRTFASLPPGGAMIVAFTREHEPHLAVISKTAPPGAVQP